jgi:hypothetical protein
VLALLLVLAGVAAFLVLMTPGGDNSATPEPTPPTQAPTSPAPSSSPAPTSPAPTTPATGPRDGNLVFTVTDARCGDSNYKFIIFAGAGKELCIIDVTAHNAGKSASNFYNEDQILVDSEGNSYHANSLDVGKWVPIFPGRSAKRTLVFEVPKDTVRDHLELRDSSDEDGGVFVPLQSG